MVKVYIDSSGIGWKVSFVDIVTQLASFLAITELIVLTTDTVLWYCLRG